MTKTTQEVSTRTAIADNHDQYQSATSTSSHDYLDLESNRQQNVTLSNTAVTSLSWSNLQVTVKDHKSGDPLSILNASTGSVCAGEMLAIMGPSGSGKTTLLNVLAHRTAAAGATCTGDVLINGAETSLQSVRNLSAYVEQDDALVGSLTVKETVLFAARLSLPSGASKGEVHRRVDDLIASLGLLNRSDTIIGTPIQKGLSGGQKKRVSVASRLVTNPNILFLDEPTSGLDSAMSLEVCSYIKTLARQHNLIVIASIHQPSSAAFQQFDSLCLLSGGRTCYFGPVASASSYFSRLGYIIPPETNSAEYFLDMINTDLDRDGEIISRTDNICVSWKESTEYAKIRDSIRKERESSADDEVMLMVERPGFGTILTVLLHRLWVKSYRDVLTYGVRVAMYLGLAILMGTVFLRFETEQRYVQPYINAIFFGGAFMSFMAVAYVPAFLEDLSTFKQERANGLVGPLAFLLANFMIGIPFLFVIAVLFSVVEYWLSGFRPDASSFFMWILWLFLDLLAAESLVVLVSSIFDIFVVALAVTAFANGLWMCVDGFLVPMDSLNAFWKYVFHYIDYQAYVFQGMMVNEFQHREYKCQEGSEGQYQCSFPSDLNYEGKFRGTDVLDQFDIATGRQGTWLGIMVGIIAGYRILAYIVLILRK